MNEVGKLSRNIAAVKYFVDRIMTTQIECFDKNNLDISYLWTKLIVSVPRGYGLRH